MADSPSNLSAMRRALGGAMRAYREAAGLTQGDLGRATGYDRTYICHIEAGRYLPSSRSFWEIADKAVKAFGRMLNEYDRVNDKVLAVELEEITKKRAANELRVSHLGDYEARSSLVEYVRLSSDHAKPERVQPSDRTLRSHTVVTQLLAGQRQTIEPDALLSLVTAHRDAVASLFRRTTSARLKDQFGRLLGETSVVASRVWSALGNRSMALAHCAFARKLGDELDNPTLGAVARMFESNLRSDAATLIGRDGDIIEGLQMLTEASAAEHLLPPAARARLAAEQAQAL